jgi:hypothetical protein
MSRSRHPAAPRLRAADVMAAAGGCEVVPTSFRLGSESSFLQMTVGGEPRCSESRGVSLRNKRCRT